ncbi:MAG TPA: DUF5916 domain-containing protein [Vicinamibacteria bacterium]|nr:DUF5916 domain-containing protein [Vicinamibacteria bacterium]
MQRLRDLDREWSTATERLWTPRVLLAGLLATAPVAFSTSATAEAQESGESKHVLIPLVSRAPTLDDFLEGVPREAEARVSGFQQRKPRDGEPASQKTDVYLSYDAQNLYVVFVCRDDPALVRANLSRREDISSDDRVGVYLDTFLDRQRSYAFITNPLGIQNDGVLVEGQDEDFDFDTLWYSDGRLTNDGYVVWMAIPFKSLRFSAERAQSWGIALERNIVRENEEVYWPYITDEVRGFAKQFATLGGIENVASTRNLQLIPYGAFAGARLLDRRQADYATSTDGRVGVDLKYVPRDNFTLDVTANPDFSQVESDDPQVTVNQRFEVVFPEKRPFFLENANLFKTPFELFFSRRIIDPAYGGRVTGKKERWGYAGLIANDRAPDGVLDADDPLFGERANIFVGRVQRDVGQASNLGVLATSRDFGSGANRVAAFDTRLELNRNWRFEAQAGYSFFRDVDGEEQKGSALYTSLSHRSRNLVYKAEYSSLSPDFQTDLGYIKRTDIREISQYLWYRWWPGHETLLSYGPTFNASVEHDFENKLQDWYFDAAFEVELTGRTYLSASRTEAYTFYINEFRYHRNIGSVYSSPKRWLSLYAYYSQGSDVNYSPAPGLEPFLGNAEDVTFKVTLRPTSRFRVEPLYLYSSLATPKRLRGFEPELRSLSRPIFSNHLFRSKLTYQLTREWSFRLIVDYSVLNSDPTLIEVNPSKRFKADVLFTYLLNPGTALFIGYTDRYDSLELVPGQPRRIVATPGLGTSTARQIFVKMSYLFRQ